MNLPPIMGHRGAAGHAPENTLAGFNAAARLGVSWVEFDVHLSSDRIPVLLHDDTLDRTTDGKGPVDDLTAEVLTSLDAGTWFSEKFSSEKLPTLEQALKLLAALGLGANVEIKPSPGREAETGSVVARMLREQWPRALPQPIVCSFNTKSIAAARQAAPSIPRAFLVRKVSGNWGQVLRDLECFALHCNYKGLTVSDVEQVRRAGYALNIFTVNDRVRAENLLSWGAGTIISDYPDRLM